MSHLDDETVAALAVDDVSDADAAKHAAQCGECQAKVTQIRELADRIGSLGETPTLLTPPAHVWDAIAAELGDELGSALTSEQGAERADERAAPQALSTVNLDERRAARDSGASDRFAQDGASLARDSASGGGSGQGAKRGGRRTTWLIGIAAGVAGIATGAAVVAGLIRDPVATGDVVAQAALTDLASEADAGTAKVEVLDDGTRVLVLDTDFEDIPDAYLEVWLIDPNIEGMVSLGHLTQADEQFVIPEGFDVAAFPIVDISVEPLDGVPTHSGDSVTRGVLG
jgi:hypothetical protein